MNALLAWVEGHPAEAAIIGGGGVLVMLYFFGFFGSSASNAGGASNLAAAYYAAESNQAAIGGQIQLATVNDAAATAQVQDQVQGAVAINAAQQSTYGQISDNQTAANASNNAANIAMNASNNAAAVTIGAQQTQTTIGQTILGQVVPAELAQGYTPSQIDVLLEHGPIAGTNDSSLGINW